MFSKCFEISGVTVGQDAPPYVIAEISGNHGGDFERACELVRAAAKAGADAVKLQTYTADTITLNSANDEFLINDKKSPWFGRKLYDLYNEAHTPWEWHPELFKIAKKSGITIFSTPFDNTSVDFLEELNVPCYKISSFEMTDHLLLRYVAATKKPIIMSTGTATLSEIAESVEVLREFGCKDLLLLVCVSVYPAPASAMRLNRIQSLQNTFKVPVGLSDHTLGNTIPLVAVGSGASVVEKHFTLSDGLKTVDSSFSITNEELECLCKDVKLGHIAIGDKDAPWGNTDRKAAVYRRSLYFITQLKKGQLISETDIKSVRPGCGLETKFYDQIIGKRVACDVDYGIPVLWDYITE